MRNVPARCTDMILEDVAQLVAQITTQQDGSAIEREIHWTGNKGGYMHLGVVARKAPSKVR